MMVGKQPWWVVLFTPLYIRSQYNSLCRQLPHTNTNTHPGSPTEAHAVTATVGRVSLGLASAAACRPQHATYPAAGRKAVTCLVQPREKSIGAPQLHLLMVQRHAAAPRGMLPTPTGSVSHHTAAAPAHKPQSLSAPSWLCDTATPR